MWWPWAILGLLIVAGLGGWLTRSIVRVPSGMVGVVYRRSGLIPLPDTLRADSTCLLPYPSYRVRFVPRTHVAVGTIGAVVAKVGAVHRFDRVLSQYVECDYFQDGRAFLAGGGEQGRQPLVLPGGTSFGINPELFDVVTVDTIGSGRHGLTVDDLRETSVLVGTAGVVIALDGEQPGGDDEPVAPVVAGHTNFQRPWVFLAQGGRRGVQAETLEPGGIYRINPWFARVVMVPTRELMLEWTRSPTKSADSYDAALDEILINVEGHRLRLEVSQTIRIPARTAPRLVSRFGEVESDLAGAGSGPAPVQRFVERVLGVTVDSYFQRIAGQYRVLDLLTRYDEVRLDLESTIRAALIYYGVEAGQTVLSQVVPEGPELDQIRRQLAAQRDYERKLEYAGEHALVDVRAESRRLEVEAERRRIDADELNQQLSVLDRDSVARQRFLRELAAMRLPDFVGGDADVLLSFLPLSVAQDLVRRVLSHTEPSAPEAPAEPGAQ